MGVLGGGWERAAGCRVLDNPALQPTQHPKGNRGWGNCEFLTALSAPLCLGDLPASSASSPNLNHPRKLLKQAATFACLNDAAASTEAAAEASAPPAEAAGGAAADAEKEGGSSDAAAGAVGGGKLATYAFRVKPADRLEEFMATLNKHKAGGGGGAAEGNGKGPDAA